MWKSDFRKVHVLQNYSRCGAGGQELKCCAVQPKEAHLFTLPVSFIRRCVAMTQRKRPSSTQSSSQRVSPSFPPQKKFFLLVCTVTVMRGARVKWWTPLYKLKITSRSNHSSWKKKKQPMQEKWFQLWGHMLNNYYTHSTCPNDRSFSIMGYRVWIKCSNLMSVMQRGRNKLQLSGCLLCLHWRKRSAWFLKHMLRNIRDATSRNRWSSWTNRPVPDGGEVVWMVTLLGNLPHLQRGTSGSSALCLRQGSQT